MRFRFAECLLVIVSTGVTYLAAEAAFALVGLRYVPLRLQGDRPGDRLRRQDRLYDFIVEIDHNTRPRIAGRGSAVFLHLARDHFAPTAGCIAMTRSAMLQLLRRLGPATRIVID